LLFNSLFQFFFFWFQNNIKRWYKWHKKGINIKHDIVDETERFLSAVEIEQKFNTRCDILKYNAINDAIPQELRKIIKTMRVTAEAISFQEQNTFQNRKYSKTSKFNKKYPTKTHNN
jgi:hypothetical protein